MGETEYREDESGEMKGEEGEGEMRGKGQRR